MDSKTPKNLAEKGSARSKVEDAPSNACMAISAEDLAAKLDACIDDLIRSDSPSKRVAVAERGYGLERLIEDEDPMVRYAVARQGFGLERLIGDEDPDVRLAAAQECDRLDLLLDDEDPLVRLRALEDVIKKRDETEGSGKDNPGPQA